MAWITYLALHTSAYACTCTDFQQVTHILPADGDVGVPLNAQIGLIARGGVGNAAVELRHDGLPIDGTQSVETAGRYERVSFQPSVQLAQHTEYEAWVAGRLAATFETGTDPDYAAPAFEGIGVTSNQSSGGGCGEILSHTFSTVGLMGEYSSLGVWVLVEPTDTAFPSAMDGPTVSVVSNEVCWTTDETLQDDFHRSYSVTVVDVAGNRTEPIELRTRGRGMTVGLDGGVIDSVGCSSSNEHASWRHSASWLQRRRDRDADQTEFQGQ